MNTIDNATTVEVHSDYCGSDATGSEVSGIIRVTLNSPHFQKIQFDFRAWTETTREESLQKAARELRQLLHTIEAQIDPAIEETRRVYRAHGVLDLGASP